MIGGKTHFQNFFLFLLNKRHKTWRHISSSVLFVAKESIDASPLPNPNIGIIAKRSGRKRQGDIRLIRLEHCCWEGQLCHITLWSPGEEHKSGKARMILMLLECDKIFSSKQMNTCTKKYGKRDGPLTVTAVMTGGTQLVQGAHLTGGDTRFCLHYRTAICQVVNKNININNFCI